MTQPDKSRWRDPSGYTTVGAMALLGTIGFLIGHAVMHVDADGTPESATYSELPEFSVHAGIIAAEVAFWFVLVPLMAWWAHELRARFRVRSSPRSVVAGVVGVLLLLVVPFILNRSAADYPLVNGQERTNVLYLLAVPVVVMAVVVLDLIDRVGRAGGWVDSSTGAATWDVGDFRMLERIGRAMLAVLGAVISLIVLGTGALFNALDAYAQTASRPESEPSQAMLLVYGALFVVALVLLIAPARAAIAAAGERLVDRSVPAATAADSELATTLAKRADLRQQLDLDVNFRQALERSVVVLSPLLSGIVALFLTSRS